MSESLPHGEQSARRTLFAFARFLIILIVVVGAAKLVFEGILIAWRPIMTREAGPEDGTRTRYFGFDLENVDEVRKIAVVEGPFSKGTWLSAWLYLVRSGKVEQASAFTVGRSPNRIGESTWINMKIALALAESEQAGGRITHLGSAGHTRGEGGIGEILHDIRAVEKQTLPGRLRAGRKCILHVEGDRTFEVRREMSVEDFARQNPGNFVVVAVQLD